MNVIFIQEDLNKYHIHLIIAIIVSHLIIKSTLTNAMNEYIF